MPHPDPQVPYVEVQTADVPEDHALGIVRDHICRSLGLPAIRIRYFQRASGSLADRATVTLSNIARSLELWDEVEGFDNSARLGGLTILGDPDTVWLRVADNQTPLERVKVLAHELRHQQQAMMFRTRTGAQAEVMRRNLRERKEAVKQWMEEDAERYAEETMAKLERGEAL